MVELIPCAALLFSREGTILAANQMFCDLAGYAPDELLHRCVADLTDGEERQLADAIWRIEIISKSGEAIPCEVTRKCMDGPGPRQCLALLRKFSEQSDSELILHAIDEGFVLLDRDFRIQRINDEALRIDGRPREAFIGKSHWEGWPGSEQLPIADAYRKAMRERSTATIEQLYVHNGEDMWLEARAFPVEDGLAVFYRDITQRKQAEAAIRNSEAKCRTIADAMPQIVWSARPDGFHDYFNKQWYEYTGVPDDVAQGRAWAGLFHPDDVEPMEARWQHSLSTGEPYEMEFRLRHRSGEYRWALARALPVRNANGEIVRWMGTSTDIHENMEMRAALRDAQSRLEAALNAAQIGTWTWDIQPDRVHADRNLAAMFGISPESADGAPISAYLDAVHPEDEVAVRAGIAQSVASGVPYHESFRLRAPNGGILSALVEN